VDRAAQEEEFALELRARDRERKLIKKIEKTLIKLEDDDFGYCEHCGIEIGIRRLEARPTAELCVDLQEPWRDQRKSRWRAKRRPLRNIPEGADGSLCFFHLRRVLGMAANPPSRRFCLRPDPPCVRLSPLSSPPMA
jgi:hypothetical protein